MSFYHYRHLLCCDVTKCYRHNHVSTSDQCPHVTLLSPTPVTTVPPDICSDNIASQDNFIADTTDNSDMRKETPMEWCMEGKSMTLNDTGCPIIMQYSRYGYYDQHGKLNIVNYTADPYKGFHAEGEHVPQPQY